MGKILNKIKFILKRPIVVVVAGRGKETAIQAIKQVLSPNFKVGQEVLVYSADSQGISDFNFMIKNSRKAVLVATHIGEYHYEKEFFAGDLKDSEKIAGLAEMLPAGAHLVLNYDDETVRDICNKNRVHPVFFGLGARAEFRASDIVLAQFPRIRTNFKINYSGKTVPVWLEGLFGREYVYAALSAAAVGEVLGLHLVEISSALKSYEGVQGRMKLVAGIKNSFILDDSENASALSMFEGLDLLKKINTQGKKIAVFGDIVGIGKYTVETHEAIGEEAARSADLLFTVGDRAKFFAKGAKNKGMEDYKIFNFNETSRAGLFLQEKIAPGDLILVDGSKEIKMGAVVEEIKA